MILLLVGALTLAGGTAWLALNQQLAPRPGLHRRFTAAGLGLCPAIAASAVVAAVVTSS